MHCCLADLIDIDNPLGFCFLVPVSLCKNLLKESSVLLPKDDRSVVNQIKVLLSTPLPALVLIDPVVHLLPSLSRDAVEPPRAILGAVLSL